MTTLKPSLAFKPKIPFTVFRTNRVHLRQSLSYVFYSSIDSHYLQITQKKSNYFHYIKNSVISEKTFIKKFNFLIKAISLKNIETMDSSDVFKRSSGKNPFPYFIRIHIKIFQFLGFVPIQFTASTSKSFLSSTAVIKNIIAQLLIVFLYIYQDKIFYNGYGFGNFCDILKVVFCAIAYEVLLLECLWNGKPEQLIYRLIGLLDSKRMTISRFKWFLTNLYFYIGIWTSIECIYVYIKREDSQSVNIWCIYNFLVLAIRIRTIHFMFILKMINCQIDLLNEDLKSFVKNSEKFNGNVELLRQQLFIFRKTHLGLLEMVEIFNEHFKWGLIFNHFRIYTKMIVDIYWNIFVYYMHTHPIGRFSN